MSITKEQLQEMMTNMEKELVVACNHAMGEKGIISNTDDIFNTIDEVTLRTEKTNFGSNIYSLGIGHDEADNFFVSLYITQRNHEDHLIDVIDYELPEEFDKFYADLCKPDEDLDITDLDRLIELAEIGASSSNEFRDLYNKLKQIEENDSRTFYRLMREDVICVLTDKFGLVLEDIPPAIIDDCFCYLDHKFCIEDWMDIVKDYIENYIDLRKVSSVLELK